jgi:autotransporter-associated beta strand protein
MLAAVAVLVSVSTLNADVVSKEDNADALSLGSSWVGGIAPDTNDVATWDATVTAGATYSLGSDLSWQGVSFLNPFAANYTVDSGSTLTLGAGGISNPTFSKTVTWNNAFVLAAEQTWSVSGGTHAYAGPVDTAGHVLTLAGSSTKQFKGAISGGGAIHVVGGTFKLTNPGANAATLAVTATVANVTYDTASGQGNEPRTGSITLNGGSFNVGGRSGSDTVETNAHALTVGPGSVSTVTVTANAAKNAQLYSGSFERPVGNGIMSFRGSGLGTNALDALVPNSANIVFGTVPVMLGAGGDLDSTTNSILVGAYGDSSASGSGMGLITYDGTCGLRLLKFATEYTASITDGQAQLDNVRLTNSVNVVLTNTLSNATTVNSLSFAADAGTELQHGVRIDGAGVLTVNSGVIFASLNATAVSTANSFVLDCGALDLGGQEGVFIARSMGAQGGGSHGGGTLEFACAITNDGGKGVTVSGSVVKFSGGSTNTYTGDTRCNYGFLWLAKSNSPLPGDLVVNGGSVQNTGNQIADDRDLYVNGGTYNQKGGDWNSGSGAWETFRNLHMTGGSYGDGANGTSSGNTFLTNACLSGGTWTVTQGHSTRIGGELNLSGGLLNVYRANDTSRNTTVTVVGRMTVTNTLAGAYTPISITGGAGAGVNGGWLVLSDDAVFVGNSENTNAVTINATAASSGGLDAQVRLDGTRTLEVGDGAAEVDVVIVPVLADNGATVGGLTKLGEGTLMLMATNAYTGVTTVGAGALALNGSVVSPVTVHGGASLSGTGVVNIASGTAVTVEAGGIVNPGDGGAVGTLTVNGDVSFANGAVLRVDVDGGSADRLAVSGAVAGGPATVDAVGEGTAPWLILTATEITGLFSTTAPGLVVSKRANGTELWLLSSQGTLISVQ